MLDIINLNPEYQSQLTWIFLESVLFTDYKTEAEFYTFLRKLNEDWLIMSRRNSALAPEDCLRETIGDILKNHIYNEDRAESCHQELTSKWVFHRKKPLGKQQLNSNQHSGTSNR